MARWDLDDLAGLQPLAAAVAYPPREFHVYVKRWSERPVDPFPAPVFTEQQGSRIMRLWSVKQVEAWCARNGEPFDRTPIRRAHEQ